MINPHVVTTTTFKLLDTNNRPLIIVEGDEMREVSIQDCEDTLLSATDLVTLLRSLADAISTHYARD